MRSATSRLATALRRERVTLFFSMGKRQRLYPRILIDLLIEVAGLAPIAIGEVRAFDNYSFADIDPQSRLRLFPRWTATSSEAGRFGGTREEARWTGSRGLEWPAPTEKARTKLTMIARAKDKLAATA